MSNGFQFNAASDDDYQGVVVIHFGGAPMDFLSKCVKVVGKEGIIDPTVARMAGANIAVGEPRALELLRRRLAPGAIAAELTNMPGNLPAGAIEWLAVGERGTSSETIFSTLTGSNLLKGRPGSHPSDPDDFRRCRLLLEAVPSLGGELHRMRAVSPTWSRLIDNWDPISKTMDEETPEWRTPGRGAVARRTYDLMSRVIGK